MTTKHIKIKKGFNYDEALLLSQFCKQVYDIFQYDDGSIDDTEIKEIYNSIHRSQDWRLVHTIRNDKTNIRGFILKKTEVEQYAVVFRGTIITDRGVLELTDAITDASDELVDYGSTTVARVKVAKGFFEAADSVADEVKLFFKTLLGRLTIKDFLAIKESTPLRQFACLQALIDAGTLRLGSEFEQEAAKIVYDALIDGEIGNDDDLEIILDFNRDKLLHLESLGEPVEVYVAGHSMGGAVSQLTALDLQQQFGAQVGSSGFKLKVYTLGAPKVGNQEFADYYNKLIVKGLSYRVENLLDVVHQIPLPPPFPLSLFARNGLRFGDFFLANYVPVGEVHEVAGLGSQSVSLGFGSALEFGGGIPFPHSYDTYFSLLQEDQQRWSQLLNPIKTVLGPFLEELIEEALENKK